MLRRILIIVGVLLVVLIAAAVVGDLYARSRVESMIAQRIEQRVPGSHASVHISSFPFVGRLAVSGSVPEVKAKVTSVTEGRFTFSLVNVDVRGLKLQRSQLIHGHVDVTGVSRVTVHATMTQQALDQAVGVPVVLGDGTVSVGDVSADITVTGGRVYVGSTGFAVPALALLPCVSGATVSPGQLVLSCVTTTIPPALANGAVTV